MGWMETADYQEERNGKAVVNRERDRNTKWRRERWNRTTTTTVLRPFVRDYPGEPVPEETLTHPPS